MKGNDFSFLKPLTTIVIVLLFVLNGNAQSKIRKVSFYPTQLTIDGINVPIDSTSTKIKLNSKSRLIIWESEELKLSVLCEIKKTKKRCSKKMRIETFRNGRWRKSKFKLFYDRPAMKLTRWDKWGYTKGIDKGASKSSIPVKKVLVNAKGQTIEIIGTCVLYVEY